MSQTTTSNREAKLKQLRELKLQASIRRSGKTLIQPVLSSSLLAHNAEMERLHTDYGRSPIPDSLQLHSGSVVLTEESRSSRNDEMSVRSDMTCWGDFKTLQEELARKKRDTERAMRRFVIAESELGKATEKVAKLEEELRSLRVSVRNLAKKPRGRASEIPGKNQGLIMVKNEEVAVLNKELNSLYEENRSYNEHLNNLRLEHARFLNQSQSSFKTLTEEIEKLKNRPARSSQSNQEIQAAIFEREKIRTELDSVLSEVEGLHAVIQQKDETIDDLDKNLDILQKRNESLLEALNVNYSQFSQPAEPPPEQSSLFMPIVDIYPQTTHSTLVADVGSTGAWIEREEEQKEAHMASPDPFENLLHQATGETVYQLSEDIEAATPPIDQPWASTSVQEPELESERRTPPASQRSLREEESKGPGTPKREEARSRPSSRSSTPPRNMYERSSPAPQQPTSQRVHNLIQPQNPRHYSIPCNPFSSSLEPEDDDFFSQMMKESKQPKKLPQSFFE